MRQPCAVAASSGCSPVRAPTRRVRPSAWKAGLAALLLLAAGAAGAAGPTAVEGRKNGFSLNLRDADVRELITTVAEITGTNFIVDPRVTGSVTVISASPMSREQVYETFLSTLHVNGFLAIPSGDAVKIVPDISGITTAPVGKGDAGESGDTVVTRIIEVRHVDVRQLMTNLRPLLPQNAHVSAHPESNVLVVTDTAANVTRLATIVSQIDRDTARDAEVVPVQNADATELARVLASMLQSSLQQGEGRVSATVVADPHSNSLLVSGPPAERKSIRALVARLDRPASSSGMTEVIRLRHAVAKDLVKVMQGVGDQQMKGNAAQPRNPNQRFDIQADEASNSLIITAPPDVMGDVKRVIAKLDVRRAQVHVEGIIAEVSTDKALELGVEWRTSLPLDGLGAISRSQISGGETSRFPGGTGDEGGLPEVLGNGLTLGYFVGGDLRALLKALKSDTGANILSTPSVVTLDNQKALIHVGQNIPLLAGQYQTPSGSASLALPFQTYERRDVGVKLTVVPQITEGDTVRLEIKQEVSSVVPSSGQNQSATTNERTIETTVLVDNGQIIALGGLVADDLTEIEAGVPLLADIPLMGEFFKTRRTTAARKNLMVFLRPTILRDGVRSEALTQARYEQVREVQLQQQAASSPFTAGGRKSTLAPYPPAPDLPPIVKPEPAAEPGPEPSPIFRH